MPALPCRMMGRMMGRMHELAQPQGLEELVVGPAAGHQVEMLVQPVPVGPVVRQEVGARQV